MKANIVGVLALAASGACAGAAIAAEDWSRSDRSTGLVYYRCEAPACTVGAVISCKARVADEITSLERYRKAMTVQEAAWTNAGAVVRFGAPTSRALGPWVLYQHPYTVERAGSPRTQFRGGYLTGAAHGFSIVSSSNDAAVTKRNFDRVVRRLTSSPIEEALERCTVRPGAT